MTETHKKTAPDFAHTPTSIEAAIAAEEDLVIDIQFLIQEMLNNKEISRSDLSKLTGLSEAKLSRMMRKMKSFGSTLRA
jgi:uncharacterized membrane protein